MESLERGLVLAKQVLSQLSYTPTVGVPFILKHLLRFQNPFPRIFVVLQAKLPLRALEHAIANRQPPPGVVHHSDQGVQYVCRDYMQALHEYQMLPSMSRPANPYDNATCESFLRTLKREEINANTYRDFERLNEGLKEFIEQYYNRYRLHSALSYQSPEGFEKHAAQTRSEATGRGPLVTFFGT